MSHRHWNGFQHKLGPLMYYASYSLDLDDLDPPYTKLGSAQTCERCLNKQESNTAIGMYEFKIDNRAPLFISYHIIR